MKLRTQLGNIFVVLAAVVFVFLIFTDSSFAGSLWEGWTGDIFAGYNKTSGNTEKASGSMSAQAIKQFEHSQFQLKGNIFYSKSSEKMDGQKWDALSKYSIDFGKDYKWYNFYQVFVDHDYFADIDYRITPSVGIGYHIANSEDWTWDADAGIGYRITRHRINTAEDDEAPTALAHTFMKKKVFEKSFLSEDLTVYPGLKSNAGVILRSETAFTNALNEKLDLEIKYILDYNSEPAEGKKKSDTQIVAGIKYKF
jgi:putative salt-induced outer membrane protein